MLKFFVRWRVNPKEVFKTPEEREKFLMLLLGQVNTEMQDGVIKDWGSYVDGSGGFLIYEVPNEADVFASLRKWTPHIDFDVRQVLTIQQLIEARK
ncbi:MAG TPA: DUF3303 family protein [Acidobacteriota bacterium]|nr:DUF3303 family protein [Acidobacteriota bacterium]